MANRELTQEEKQHIEALIKTQQYVVNLCRLELDNLEHQLKASQSFFRHFGQPVLIPAESPDEQVDQMIKQICDSCEQSDLATLEILMKIKMVKCFGVGYKVE